jgi:hypothetical protein
MKVRLFIKKASVKFILLKNLSEKIFEFGVDLGDLIFLCSDLSKARIKNYPIIIFEFTEGFYTTRDLYVNNTYNYELEPFLTINNFSKTSGTFHYTNNLTTSNSSTPSGSSKLLKSNTLQTYFVINPNKKEVKFSTLNEKLKQFEFFDKQMKVINGDKTDKIKQLENQLQITNDALIKFYKKYKMMINIDKMRKQVVLLNEKINNNETTIDAIKKIISQKQSDLHISSSIFFLNRENYKDKIETIEKNYKKIEKYKIMYNSFKNKKLIEVAYLFFNKMCYKFYVLPSFVNQVFDNVNKLLRFQFYEKYTKELSVMMGNVANIINYLSKLFNIPLKFPLFINGSRSFIVKDKKE